MKKIIDRLEFEVLDFFVKVGIAAIIYFIGCWFLHYGIEYTGKMVAAFAILVVFIEATDFALVKIGVRRRVIC